MEPDDAPASVPDPKEAGEAPQGRAAGSPASTDGAGDLGRALLLAQQVADETIADARRQADLLIAEARVEPIEQRTPADGSPAAAGAAAAPPTPPELGSIVDLVTSLTASISDELTRAAEILDSIRLDASARMGAISAELERLRGEQAQQGDCR